MAGWGRGIFNWWWSNCRKRRGCEFIVMFDVVVNELNKLVIGCQCMHGT